MIRVGIGLVAIQVSVRDLNVLIVAGLVVKDETAWWWVDALHASVGSDGLGNESGSGSERDCVHLCGV